MLTTKFAGCLAGSLVVALGAGLATPAAAAAAAAPAVQLTRVYVNSPGSDTGSNTSVNGEYVVIKNVSRKAVSLGGWTLRDETNHVYRFAAFTLQAGKTVTVYSGRGTNSASKRFWGSTWHIWNNSGGDSATLRNASGAKVDSCGWKTVAAAVSC